MTYDVISRDDAILSGMKRYFTGQPCIHGHIAQRFVSSKNCIECSYKNYGNWKSVHGEILNRRRREKYAEDPEPHLERSRVYRRSNQDKIKASFKRWTENNSSYFATRYQRLKPLINEAATKWRKNNPDKARAISATRRARVRHAKGRFTAEDIQSLYKLQRGKCVYCRKPVSKKFHIDHIVPISKGGTNFAYNLQILCQPCNNRKAAKDPIKFAREMGYLL